MSQGSPTPSHTVLRLKANAMLGDGEWHDYEAVLEALIKLIPPGVAIRRNEMERRAVKRAPAQRARPLPVADQIRVGARRMVIQFLNNNNFEYDRPSVPGRASGQPRGALHPANKGRRIRLVKPFGVGGKYAEPLLVARDQALHENLMLRGQLKLLRDYLVEIGHGAAADRLAPDWADD